MGLIGPEVADAKALNIPIDQAEVLVTNKSLEGKALKEFRNEDFAGQLQVVRIERGGVPIPLGADTQLQRFDVLFVAGLKSAVNKLAAMVGKVARPSTATDLLTLSVGMVARPAHRADQRADRQLLRRPRQCGRPAALGHLRLVHRFAAALLRQHAQRGPQHPRRPRPGDVHRHRRHQRRAPRCWRS